MEKMFILRDTKQKNMKQHYTVQGDAVEFTKYLQEKCALDDVNDMREAI